MISRDGRTGEPWTRMEIDAVVAGYVSMLRMELRGEHYSKAEAVRQLRVLVPARSGTSIERKLQNISAVLDETGLDWIDGYKPLAHYQHELKSAVLAAVGPGHRLGEALADYGSSPLVAARARRLATGDVEVAPPGSRAGRRSRTSVALTGSALSGLRDFQARKLGAAGEEWVMDLEREKLGRLGRRDLAERVVWVARDEGDGVGYDVRSYREDGRDRLIEVKTTNHGPRTPFYITRWEIEVSRRELRTRTRSTAFTDSRAIRGSTFSTDPSRSASALSQRSSSEYRSEWLAGPRSSRVACWPAACPAAEMPSVRSFHVVGDLRPEVLSELEVHP